MAENLLEQLDQRIQRKENVTAADVADTYTQFVENRRKEYLAKGGKYENFETEEKAFLDTAKALRNKCLEGIGALGAEFEKKQQAVANEARDKERHVKYTAARAYGWNATDPDKDGAEIPDYYGTGEDNRLGFGRSTLAGYLVGLQMVNPQLADQAYRKAVEMYKTNYDTTLDIFVDYFLSDENVKELVGRKYLNQLDAFPDLARECRGYLAAYLRLSDESFPKKEDKDGYASYLFSKVGELKKGLSLSGKEGDSVTHWQDVATVQLDAFEAVQAPKEWQQMWREKLQKTFDPFKKSCDTLLAANPDFKFQDPAVNLMLSKSLDDLSYLDDAKLNEAVEKARKEFAAYMQTKKDIFGKDVEANKKATEGLKARNKALRAAAVTEDEWKALDAALGQQSTDLDAASPNPNSSLADLTLLWNKLAMVRDSNGLLKTKLDDLEKKTKDAEEKEPFVLKFLDEKNLSEKYDDKSKQWSYQLGEPGFEVRGNKVVSSFKNPDVQKLFESKVTPFINGLLDKKPLTADEKKHVDEIMAKADKNNKDQVRAALQEATEYVLAQTQAKLTSDDLIKFQQIDRIIGQAKKDCAFSFDHRPTLEELKKTYDAKFVPAWDKAGKDFETQVKPTPKPAPDKVPGGSGGGGFLGGGRSPERPVSTLDPYGDNWGNGTKVPMPEGFKGYAGGLQVSSAIVDIKFRDENTHRITVAVPGGTGAGSNEITFADPNADAWRVNDRTFVKVKYRGKVYYAAMEFLQKNTAGQSGKDVPAQKTPETKKPPEAKDDADLAFLGGINSEYRDALEKIWKDRENPDGPTFKLRFNKLYVTCNLRREGGEWRLYWNTTGGGKTYMPFSTLKQAMKDLNDGYVLRRMTWDQLRDTKEFKRYRNIVDKLDEHEPVPNSRTSKLSVFFELDWHGGGVLESGDPYITATALPHGHIEWSMNRENSGPNGENSRNGYAANFDDFMKQLAHIKIWNENYNEKKMNDAKSDGEKLYATLTDPRTFMDREQNIGHVVSFDIMDNQVVQMYLDWGGGASTDFMKNAMLNVWIENGKLSYILNFKGKSGYTENGSVRTLDELTQKVAQAKSAAAGGVRESAARSTVETPPPTPKAASKPKSAPSATPVAAETPEEKEQRNRLADGVKKKSSDAYPR